jgi:hypothetical protein
MASPAPTTGKRSRKGKEKARETQLEEVELLPEQDPHPRRKRSTRGTTAALNASQGKPGLPG